MHTVRIYEGSSCPNFKHTPDRARFIHPLSLQAKKQNRLMENSALFARLGFPVLY